MNEKRAEPVGNIYRIPSSGNPFIITEDLRVLVERLVNQLSSSWAIKNSCGLNSLLYYIVEVQEKDKEKIAGYIDNAFIYVYERGSELDKTISEFLGGP